MRATFLAHLIAPALLTLILFRIRIFYLPMRVIYLAHLIILALFIQILFCEEKLRV
jgi:hypothetical protein